MRDYSRYVGIPFKERGRDFNGCDCWGLVRLVYHCEYGVDLPDLAPLYSDTRDFVGMRSVHAALAPSWAMAAKPNEGDVALLNILDAPIHVGLVIDDERMLHVERGLDAVVERFNSLIWRPRLAGFYRLLNHG